MTYSRKIIIIIFLFKEMKYKIRKYHTDINRNSKKLIKK